MEYKHGSHSIYDLKYHVVFCTKYRHRILTGQVGIRARELIREGWRSDYVDMVSGWMGPDQVHVVLAVPARIGVAKLRQYLRGSSGGKLLAASEHLRKRYWGQHLWASGYFAVTAGNVNEHDLQEYIEKQEQPHKEDDFKISVY
ncbi:MAG: IS200/IS605 family transposase [Gammaproteobacteria bacterium]|nr:IS200/IS605 family transposase [Gammaproteobacteria bacterium]